MNNAGDFVIENGVLKKYCGRKKDVVIPNGVLHIGAASFLNRKSITSVLIPPGVVSVDERAFFGCESLVSVTIPDSVVSIGKNAFVRCKNLRDVTIPESLKDIGKGAFYECKELADDNGFVIINHILCYYSGEGGKVEIPQSVTSICGEAFWYCESLEDVTIPEGVTSIGEMAFDGCSDLKCITIPQSVTSIGDRAFFGCLSAKSIIIPEGVSRIGNETFSSCSALRSFTIPKSVTSIGKESFCRSGVKSITIPDGVTEIGEDAFSNCKSLKIDNLTSWCKIKFEKWISWGYDLFLKGKIVTDLVIPEGMTSISEYAFAFCRSIKSVTIPDSVKSIGNNAFDGCSNLTNVIILGNGKTWGNKVFFDDDITTIHVDDIMSIPSAYRKFALRGFLEDEAFDTESIRFKSHKAYLTKNAAKLMPYFFEHSELLPLLCRQNLLPARNVDEYVQEAEQKGDLVIKGALLQYLDRLGDELTEARDKNKKEKEQFLDRLVDRIATRDPDKGIEGMTFVVTGKLEEWESRNEIREWLELHGAKLSSSVTRKTDYLVTNDTNSGSEKNRKAKEVGALAITEEEFNKMVCWKYPGGENVSIPVWVKEISRNGFESRQDLKVITIPNSVKKIGRGAFYGCSLLQDILFSTGIISIGDSAFSECRALKNITIPDSVTSIGSCAFYGCESLENVVIPKSIIQVGSMAFYRCKCLADDKGFVVVQNVLYDYCGSGGYVKIPNTVTCIGRAAFSYCRSITEVKIPEGVVSIEGKAFYVCRKLERITIPDSVTNIGEDVFGYSPNVTIYAPEGSYAEQYAKENRIPFIAD